MAVGSVGSISVYNGMASAESMQGSGRPANTEQAGPLSGTAATGQGPGQLSEAEKRQVQQLKRRDTEVRNHERAHIAAGGPYVRGGAHFEYQRGPDGRS